MFLTAESRRRGHCHVLPLLGPPVTGALGCRCVPPTPRHPIPAPKSAVGSKETSPRAPLLGWEVPLAAECNRPGCDDPPHGGLMPDESEGKVPAGSWTRPVKLVSQDRRQWRGLSWDRGGRWSCQRPLSSPTQSLSPLTWTVAIASSQASLPRPRLPINPPTCAALLPEGLLSQGGEPFFRQGLFGGL